MIRRPPRSTRTDTLFPDTTLFRSSSGAIRMHGLYDAVIDACLTKPRLQPEVRDVLRLGTHQLLSMRVPDHAAISTSVDLRSEEHTSELQSLMRISYAVFCLKKKKSTKEKKTPNNHKTNNKQG